MRTLDRKALRDLRRNWTLTLALAIIIALGITTYISSLGAYRDLGTSYQETYDRLHFADAWFRVQAAPTSVVTEIAQVKGVQAVEGRLILDTGYLLPNGDPIRSRLVGMPTSRRPRVNDVLLLEGRYFRPGDTNVTIVESHFAEFYKLHPGDEVTPVVNGRTLHLRIIGVAVSPEYLVVTPSRQELLLTARTFAVLFVPQKDVEHVAQARNTVNDVAILLRPGANRDRVLAEVRSRLDTYGLIGTITQEHQPSNEGLHMDLEGFKEIAHLMPLLILVVAAMSVYIMLSREIRTQEPQIGIMKALGYSNSAVLFHYLRFALVIGVLGTVLGIVMGVPLQRLITRVYADEVGIPIVQIRFYPDLLLISLVVSVLLLMLGSLGPARGAARIPPAQAIHLDPAFALVRGRRLFVERWVPLPTWVRLSLRNVFRIRRRSLGTALGIFFAFVLVLASWGLIDSMNFMIERLFSEVERWDLQATYNTPLMPAVLDRVKAWEGVTDVAPMLQLPARLKTATGAQDILLIAIAPEDTLRVPPLRGSMSLSEALAGNSLVTTPSVAKKLGLRVGDTVSLDTGYGVATLTLRAISEDMMASVAYVSLDQAQHIAGAPVRVFNTLTLKVNPTHALEVKKHLYAMPGAYSVQYKRDVEADWRKMMGLYYAFMGVLMAFAVVMAAAVLFNTMTVSVLERQREFATMRAIGAGGRLLGGMIAVEGLIIWLIVLVPGLVAGTWVTFQMGSTFSSDLFYFATRIHLISYVVAAVAILGIMQLSAWPSIRRVNRLNLAEATKMIT